jgi:hypothetical protein
VKHEKNSFSVFKKIIQLFLLDLTIIFYS